jgi:hypothetical protein
VPADWMDILKAWVSGHSMSDLAGDKDEDMLEFIEGALVYRLVWAMEAVRVRASAEDENLEWPNAGRAALALETGTPNYCAALLIQSGLSSRIAAMKAVTDCTADFTDLKGLRKWAGSKPVIKRQLDPKWPTPETASLWHGFVNTLAITSTAEWVIQTGEANVTWHGQAMDAGKEVRLIFDPSNNGMRVFTPGLDPIGFLPYKWGAEPSGIALGKVSDVPDKLVITYLGPSDFFSKP